MERNIESTVSVESNKQTDFQRMRKKKMLKANLKRGIPLYCMLLIPVIWYILFCYLPMAGIAFAFQDFKINRLFASEWVGFEHFIDIFQDADFWNVFKNTIILGSLNVLINFPLPILLALFFNEVRCKVFKRTVQTIAYIPHFISVVALVNIMFLLLDAQYGIINRMIIAITGKPIYFSLEEAWFRPIYIILWAWKDTGWNTIMYLAAMASIDPELYSVASLDGASRMKKVWHITLPSILPTVIIMMILAVPGIVNADFETVLLLQNIDNIRVADVINTYVYRLSFGGFGVSGGNYDYSTAVGLISSVVSMVIVFTFNYISRKAGEVSLW